MACPTPKYLTSRSMQLVAVALLATGAIQIFVAERAAGQVSEHFWRNNERARDARAAESSG